METDTARISALSERLLDGVLAFDGVEKNVRDGVHLPHTLSLRVDRAGFFPFMLAADLAISSTSACSSASGAVSHVLSAIGLDEQAAARTIRVSLGRFTTEHDVDRAITCIRQAVDQCLVMQ